MLQLRNTAKSIFDSGYRKDRAIAQELGGVDISPEQYDKLKEVGTLAETFSEEAIMTQYTGSGVYQNTGTADSVQDLIKNDVAGYIQEHAGMDVG